MILQNAANLELSWEAVMVGKKTATLTRRIEPSVKELLRAAREEYRSIANMAEVMILDYYQRNDVPLKDSDKSES